MNEERYLFWEIKTPLQITSQEMLYLEGESWTI